MVAINEKDSKPVSFYEFCNAVAQRLNIDQNKLLPDASWVDDVGISSVDIVKIVMLIRQKFGVKISTTQAGRIKTVQNAYQLLESALNNS
ncbi:acyl carrier protein [Nostoc sp.]|uniref:acyl carrier protein n=1 Tax=Nostoc sp. TaxID=1180 RepID=UPI002FFCAE28